MAKQPGPSILLCMPRMLRCQGSPSSDGEEQRKKIGFVKHDLRNNFIRKTAKQFFFSENKNSSDLEGP